MWVHNIFWTVRRTYYFYITLATPCEFTRRIGGRLVFCFFKSSSCSAVSAPFGGPRAECMAPPGGAGRAARPSRRRFLFASITLRAALIQRSLALPCALALQASNPRGDYNIHGGATMTSFPEFNVQYYYPGAASAAPAATSTANPRPLATPQDARR